MRFRIFSPTLGICPHSAAAAAAGVSISYALLPLRKLLKAFPAVWAPRLSNNPTLAHLFATHLRAQAAARAVPLPPPLTTELTTLLRHLLSSSQLPPGCALLQPLVVQGLTVGLERPVAGLTLPLLLVACRHREVRAALADGGKLPGLLLRLCDLKASERQQRLQLAVAACGASDCSESRRLVQQVGGCWRGQYCWVPASCKLALPAAGL